MKFHQKSKDIHECERESQSEAILNLKKDSIEKNKMDARIDTPHFYEAPFDTLGDDSAPKGLDKKSPMNS